MNTKLNEILLTLKHRNIKFRKNQILFRHDERTNDIYLILKGRIDIIMTSLNGEEEIISSLNQFDIFANALVFASNPSFFGDVVAKEDGELIVVSKKDIINKIKEDEIFLSLYIQELSSKTMELNIRSKLLGHKNIRDRIIYFLQINKGSINMTINDLSKILVLPRPSVSRELIKMSNEDIIIKKGRFIALK